MPDYSEPTEVTTADGETVARTGGGSLKAVIVNTNGTADAVLELYDGTVAGGTKKLEMNVAGADLGREFAFPGRGIKFTGDITVIVTGTGASAFAYTGA